AELQQAVPLENAGSPERHGQRHAHHQLNQRRQRGPLDQVVCLVGQQAQPKTFTRIVALIDDHHASPRATAVNAPAWIIPAMFAARSKEEDLCAATAAASPSDCPAISLIKKDAPPAGKCRTMTSRSGRVINASSGTVASIGPTGSGARLVAKIV